MGACTALVNPSTSERPQFRSPKYFATVLGPGFFVSSETTIINKVDPITIGTTGMKP
jgi:hypothetical protein